MRSRRLVFLALALLLAPASACKERQEKDTSYLPDDAGESGEQEDEADEAKVDLYGSPLPDGAVARLGSVRFLDRSLQYLTYTPNGERIVSNTAGGYVLWDAESAEKLGVLEMENAYWPIAVAPGGQAMATGVLGGEIQLWDLKARETTARLDGHRQEVSGLCFLKDERLVSASDDGSVILWDLEKGEPEETLKGKWEEVTALACRPGGDLVVWGTGDGGVYWYDREAPEWKQELGQAKSRTRAVAISGEGKYVAAGSADGTVRVWSRAGADAGKANDPVAIEAHDETVHSLVFHPESGHLYSSGGDAWFRVWNPENGKLVRDIPGVEELEAQYMTLSPDGARIASWSEYATARGTEGGRWWLWETETGHELLEPARHDDDVADVAWAPDGETIATASFDGTVRVWDAESSKVVAVQESHQGRVRDVEFSEDGTVWSAGEDAKLHIFDPETQSVKLPLEPIGGEVTSFDLSPDGELLVTGDLVGRGWVFEMKTGRKLRSLVGERLAAVTDVAFTADGSEVVITGTDRTILVADPKTSEETALLEPKDVVSNQAVLFAPGGKLMATAGDDHEIRLWKTDPWKEIGALEGHDGTVRCLAFSPDGKRLASGGNDTVVRLWDLEEKKEIRAFEGHRGAVTGVAFSPDGERLVSSSGDHTALVWTLP